MNDKLLQTKQRGFFYALYSRVFLKEVDSDFLKALENRDIQEFFPNLAEWDLYKKLSKEDLVNQHLNVDFTEISLVNLIPYESFYLREDGMIESGGDNPIYKFYEQFDFVVEKDVARVLSPDHIGVELEFMYMLCQAEEKALKEEDTKAALELREIQKSFMETHILRWVPLYLINVKNEAQTPLYHDGAMTGLEFILSDYEYLNA
jgi:TorA maturation chaperone TorD